MNREQLEKEIFEQTVKKIASKSDFIQKAEITAIHNILIKNKMVTPEELCDYTNKCMHTLVEDLKENVKKNVLKTSTEELIILKQGFDIEEKRAKKHFTNLQDD